MCRHALLDTQGMSHHPYPVIGLLRVTASLLRRAPEEFREEGAQWHARQARVAQKCLVKKGGVSLSGQRAQRHGRHVRVTENTAGTRASRRNA
jgi:hypothetical protein